MTEGQSRPILSVPEDSAGTSVKGTPIPVPLGIRPGGNLPGHRVRVLISSEEVLCRVHRTGVTGAAWRWAVWSPDDEALEGGRKEYHGA